MREIKDEGLFEKYERMDIKSLQEESVKAWGALERVSTLGGQLSQELNMIKSILWEKQQNNPELIK